ENRVAGRQIDGGEERNVAEHVLRAGERRARRIEGVGVEEAAGMRDERVRVPREYPEGKVQVALHEERRRDGVGGGGREHGGGRMARERPGEDHGGEREEHGRAPGAHHPGARTRRRHWRVAMAEPVGRVKATWTRRARARGSPT